MPISDTPITFSLEGQAYEYMEWSDDKGDFVKVTGTYGPEYGGIFRLRPRSVKDKTAINNALALRYPMVNYRAGQVPIPDLSNDTALVTLRQVTIGDLPKWFDEDRLGTDLDGVALRDALRLYDAELNDRKKLSGTDSSGT